MKKDMPRTWIEIDKDNLINNIRILKTSINKKSELMAVVKANAYGHGLKEVVSILKNEKSVNWFGVFDEADALIVRKYTSKPILVLRSTPLNFWDKAVKNKIYITISTFSQLETLANWKGKKPQIHIKLDTGLGRQGFVLADQDKIISIIKNLKNIKIGGLYTHFSGMESKEFDKYSKKQFDELKLWQKKLNVIGQKPKIHASATSGALRNIIGETDISRFGIGIYGLWPSDEIKYAQRNKFPLKPVLSWKVTISEVKKIPKGSFVAYDCTYKTDRNSKIALLPVGYWDGIPRALSSKGFAIVNGVRVPIIGRVMMNMCVLDVTNVVKVEEGDTATLIGKDKNVEITADEFARLSETINYEVVTRINPLIPRVIK